jgi:hypothetical protein
VSFAAVTLYIAFQREFIVVSVIDSVRKLLDTSSYSLLYNNTNYKILLVNLEGNLNSIRNSSLLSLLHTHTHTHTHTYIALMHCLLFILHCLVVNSFLSRVYLDLPFVVWFVRKTTPLEFQWSDSWTGYSWLQQVTAIANSCIQPADLQNEFPGGIL